MTLPAASGQTGSADSSTAATVAWVRVVSGAAEMDNLTVAQDHTYAVGVSQAVVHNNNSCDPLIDTAQAAANDAGRPSATSIRIENASGEQITLPEMTFTSQTLISGGPFDDIIQREYNNGLEHAGGCGERYTCEALYAYADDVTGGYVDMGLWHEGGVGPCSACKQILQRTANELNVSIHLEAAGQRDPFDYEPELFEP